MHKTFTKNKLKFGDIVFIDNRANWNILGKMVRFIENGGKHPKTHFMPNHVGIILEAHDDIGECKIIQAGYGGVKRRALKYWIQHPKTNIIVKRCYKQVFEGRKRVLKSWLLRQEGKKYDFPALLGILLRWVLLTIIDNKLIIYFIRHLPNPLSSKIKFTCSELVARAFKEAIRISLFKNVSSGNITPYDEFRSKKIRTVAKIIQFQYEKVSQ